MIRKIVLGVIGAAFALGVAFGIPQALPAGIGPFVQHPRTDDVKVLACHGDGTC